MTTAWSFRPHLRETLLNDPMNGVVARPPRKLIFRRGDAAAVRGPEVLMPYVGESILVRADGRIGFQGTGTREGGMAEGRTIPVGLGHAKSQL